MTKRCATILALAAISASAQLPFLAKTPTDPTRMVKRELLENKAFYPYVFATATNQSAWTVIEWYKMLYTGGGSYVDYIVNLMPQSFFSVRQGISTAEGGHPVLPNLCSHSYSTPLTLTAGAWSQYILPAIGHYDLDGMDGEGTNSWKYGCYAVNIKTDTQLTLVVAGTEKTVYASVSNQVFNIRGSSADRSVSIAATSTDATVYFGIAENPLRQFFGERVSFDTIVGTVASDPLTHFCGIKQDEYVMVVNRAKMNGDGSVSNAMTAYAADVDYTTAAKGAGFARYTPNTALLDQSHFEPESRISMTLSAFSSLTNHTLYAYGLKTANRWLTDAELSHIRDLDVAEMQRRGIVFPRLAPDFWALYSWVEKTNETHTASGTATESVSGAVYEYGTTTYDESYIVHYTVTNGIASTNFLVIGDITLSCASGTVEGDKITFSNTGNYTVTGVDKLGNIRTNITAVTGTKAKSEAYAKYTADTASTWQKSINDNAWNCIASSVSEGNVPYTYGTEATNYTKRCCRRIPCQPVDSTLKDGRGHRGGVHPLSAHVVASARHYGWVVGSTQYYATPDMTVTNEVVVPSCASGQLGTGAWVGLKEWATAHDFTAEEIAAAGIDDIIVARVTSGEVPAACRPYFMTTNTFKAHFNKAGVIGWQSYRYDVGYGIPCLLEPSTTFTTAKTAASFPWTSEMSGTTVNLDGLMRDDIRTAALPTYWNFVHADDGDSGLPVYIELDNRFIMVNHMYGVWRGKNERVLCTSYIKGYDIIKAYVEAQGDTLLTHE